MAYRGMRGAGTSGANDNGFDTSYLERQNDDQVNLLGNKVSALKNIAIAIGDEVRDQNRYIDGMGSDFDSNFGLLRGVMGKLGNVSKAGGHKLLCYLIGFAMFVFFVIYWIAR